MLLIPVVLMPSAPPGGGIVCYAADAIPAGTAVWRFDPLVDRLVPVAAVVERAATDPVYRALVPRCAYVGHSDPDHYIWHGDDGRFWNHAPTPLANTVVMADETVVTLRDIAPGEELTADYRLFVARAPLNDLDWLESWSLCRRTAIECR